MWVWIAYHASIAPVSPHIMPKYFGTMNTGSTLVNGEALTATVKWTEPRFKKEHIAIALGRHHDRQVW